jgi:hypothetical protein
MASVQVRTCSTQKRTIAPTLSFLCFSLFVRSSVYASLEYLVFALVFILILVFELPRLVLVNLHRPLPIFDSIQLLLV